MKKLCLILILCIIGVSLTITGLTADETLVWKPEWPTKIRIGSGPVGGGFFMVGNSVANALKEEFPNLELIVEQTKASIHNTKLIEAGEVEFAMTTNETLYESRLGRGPNFDDQEYTKARIVMPVEMSAQEYVSLKKENIIDITQFTGQFSGMAKGGQTDSHTHKLFEFFNIQAPIVNLSPDDTVQALKVGSIQGYCMGFPNVVTEQLALTHEIRVTGYTKEQREAFTKAYPEYYPMTIPAGSYKGQDYSVDTVGTYSIVITRDDLPEELVYTAIKAIYKHQNIVEATWPGFGKDMKNLDNVKLLNLPFHKGSIKYYNEIGVELSEEASSLNK